MPEMSYLKVEFNCLKEAYASPAKNFINLWKS